MGSRKFILVFCCCTVMLIAGSGSAANLAEVAEVAEVAEDLTLYVGQVKVFPTSLPHRIIIGKPEVADVTTVTNSEITLVAKSAGNTTFVYWDNFGEQGFNIRVFSEDIQDIKQRADRLIKELNLPKVYTKAADTEEKVLLLGEVKTSQDRERIFTALGPLKDKVVDLIKVKEEEAVVDIEVQVLELNKGATETLGFTWPGSITLTDSSGPTTTAVTGLQHVFHVSDFTRTAFNVTLDTLIQEGKARILSRPRLACQSGKEAELLVGGEKPIFTTEVAATTGATGTGVEYKEYGIKLKIKPTVNEDRKIKLALNIEVSEVASTAEYIGSSTNRSAQAYPLTKRNASTELFLNDGQTMVIGGLIKQKTEEELRKVPWLADIPVLGMFFRQRSTTKGSGYSAKGDTELFITLTPTIVYKELPEPEAKVAPAAVPKKTPESKARQITPKGRVIPPNLVNYVRLVQAKILNAAYYPKQARDAGWEGDATISLNISSNGSLKGVKILQSSGYKVLDDAACEVARRLAPYPPFPPQIDAQELLVEVPIVYKKN